MLMAVLLASLGALPVTFSRCESEALDQPLLVGLLDDATRAQPIEVVCLRPGVVRVRRGPASRELELPAGSSALRARTVAFVLGELAAGRVTVTPRARPPVLSTPDAGNDALTPPALVAAPAPHARPAAPPVPSLLDAGHEPLTPPALVEAPAPQSEGSDAAPEPVDAGSARVVEALDAGPPFSPPPLPPPTWPGSPVELSVVPPLDVNQLAGWPAKNVFALGVLAARSTWLEGVSLAPVSLVERDALGVQLGVLAAWTQATLVGLQVSAAVAWTSGEVHGLQVSPVSLAGALRGGQLGLLNLTSAVTGFQVGGLNVGQAVVGAQLGVVNLASGPRTRLSGLQLGTVNVSRDVDGAQLGLLNVGGTVRGVQLGLVNISHASTVPIGLINLVDGQPMRVVLRVGTSALVQAALRLGGEYLYSFLTAGWTPRSTLRWGGGVGTHLGRGPGWFLEFELGGASAWTVEVPNSWATQVAVSAEAHVGFQVASRFAIFASLGTELVFAPPGVGPTLNLVSLPLSATTTLAPTAFLGVIF